MSRKGYIDRAVSALLARGQTCKLIAMSEKIADITHPDAVVRYISLRDLGLPDNAVILILNAQRTLGVGSFHAYPNSSTLYVNLSAAGAAPAFRTEAVVIAGQQLKYRNTNADDVWELYCHGYWVQGLT